ncbi:hypothetical protein Afil01_68110 [Actinorhabdospora filicis]|uniref:DUF2178 domain-containing protein n=1 Tax=Actinorhabdospora filicis TaxID=1785913 RepID=A0A9W6SSD0_9ACTN|nr:hypothetical protein [Actinorhabdospora filicis]GLZ82004.1 hypothetical protein Afil01_68110 [Actinorhabdospora filicis]
MAFEEKRAWIFIAVTLAAYLTYVAVVVTGAGDGPLAEASYVPAMLWSIGGAIVASVAAEVVVVAVGGRGQRRKDERDREIDRFGTWVGHAFLVIGGVAAMVMAMLETPYFWIANAVYLCFALSSLLGALARIAAYRRGFQPW